MSVVADVLINVASFGGSNIDLSAWEDKKNPSESKGAEMRPESQYSLQHTKAGLIIEKGGLTISDFQSCSGARIQLSYNNEFFPSTMDRIVTVFGPIDDVLKAVDLTLNKLLDEEVDPTITNEAGNSEGVGDFFSNLANTVPEINEAMSFATMLKYKSEGLNYLHTGFEASIATSYDDFKQVDKYLSFF
ncbi:hypothetical protein CQW23_12531 [Capsicum baccatum]|uniref:K Homology domain-containing protein n=1 Tax=Capsicum baccatum TaxID=33114 RepID=A0A2G2WSW1_CAPBA|nr:hypothetical protein CQW23_12531 [Capsicum baccatum]